MGATRSAEVPAERLPGWIERFGAAHGGVRLTSEPAPVLHAADGSTAVLDLPFVSVADGRWTDVDEVLAHVAATARSRRYVLLLLRRGGWAVGRAEGERVLAGRVGTRYVQGRTSKGGWSQQRYARRRDQQTGSVVAAAVTAATEIWDDPPDGGWELVVGGDRLLLRQAVAAVADQLPVRLADRRVDVPDPRRVVLDAAARSACATRIRVHDGPALD